MKKKVMTVDDSRTMREMVSFTLKGAGYDVVEANDGQMALNALTANKVDLVIADLNMPIMDGLALIKELRKLPAYRGIPIVLLTTESDDEKKKEAKLAGATGWITKPFKQDQLLAVVKKVIG